MKFVNRLGEIFFLNFGMIKVKQGYLLSFELHHYRNPLILGLNVGGKGGLYGIICIYFPDTVFDFYTKRRG